MTTPDDPSGNEGWRPPGESGQPEQPSAPENDPWRGLGSEKWNEPQAQPGQPQFPPPTAPPPQWGGAPPGQWQSQPYGPRPVPNYLVLGILTTLFCCQPFGIASIVFSARANGKASAGDYAGALEDARKGRMWGIIAVSVGVVLILGYFAVVAAVGFGSFNQAGLQ